MNTITTHVLDTVLGKPAAGVRVVLERRENECWSECGSGITDQDGRCRSLPAVEGGVFRIVFFTEEYVQRLGRVTVYPEIVVIFRCAESAHYHLPLLLSDNSYTTYRGS